MGDLVTKLCTILMTPWTVASQAPLSMGFSRQEHWSGLPFPSPRDLPNRGIEPRSPALQADFFYQVSYKGSLRKKVTQSCPVLCNPMDYTVHGILLARILSWVPFPSPGDLPNPGIKPGSPTLQADSLPAEPQGRLR